MVMYFSISLAPTAPCVFWRPRKADRSDNNRVLDYTVKVLVVVVVVLVVVVVVIVVVV